jgi:tetratricopeptide (TPR) repeat protein
MCRRIHDKKIPDPTGEKCMTVKEAVDLLKKGWSYARRTKYKEAFAYYNKALTLDPKNPEGYYLRASALIETGNIKKALADCERALGLNQNYADAWSKKGLALYNLGRIEDALLASTRASSLNGNDITAWYIKGVCLDELGRSDEAQEAYGKSLELEIIRDIEDEKKKVYK